MYLIMHLKIISSYKPQKVTLPNLESHAYFSLPCEQRLDFRGTSWCSKSSPTFRRVTSALCDIKLSSFWAWNLFLFYLQRLLGDYYRVCGFLCCHILHILCISSTLDCSYSGRCRSLYLAMDLPDQRSDKGKIVNEVVFNRKWSSDVIQGPWRWWSCVTGRN